MADNIANRRNGRERIAYRVNRRTPEIGVRMALGAERGQVLWMVMRESLILSAIGIAAGLPLAFAGSRLLKSMLFGLTPLDPLTFAAVALLFSAVAIVASYVPARHATRVDPLTALRCD